MSYPNLFPFNFENESASQFVVILRKILNLYNKCRYNYSHIEKYYLILIDSRIRFFGKSSYCSVTSSLKNEIVATIKRI